mmetsp:Transcript_11322/g.30150  ORF Transcript_11322/g.30150 Transcript_11322/m.30150 type:complete len:238 (+) Transcript_11322:276-989(+)
MATHLPGHEREAQRQGELHSPAEGDALWQHGPAEAARRGGREPQREGCLRLHGAARGVVRRQPDRGIFASVHAGECGCHQQERLHAAPHRRARRPSCAGGGLAEVQCRRGRRRRQGLDAPVDVRRRGAPGGVPHAADVQGRRQRLRRRRPRRAQRPARGGRARARRGGEAAAGQPRRPPPRPRRRRDRVRPGGAQRAPAGSFIAGVLRGAVLRLHNCCGGCLGVTAAQFACLPRHLY